MTTLERILTIGALCAVLALAGCGGDDEGEPIPSQDAQALLAELDRVQARLDQGSSGACRDILEGPRGPNLTAVEQQIDSLPDDVDPDVRSALEESFNRLWEQVEAECDDKAAREEAAQPEPEPEPTPTETEEEPTETEAEPPATETEPPPAEEELPPEGDGDNGGAVPGEGNGGGVGPSSAKPKKKDKSK